MLQRGHPEEEILRSLQEVEAGATGAAVCRECGISEQALDIWR